MLGSGDRALAGSKSWHAPYASRTDSFGFTVSELRLRSSCRDFAAALTGGSAPPGIRSKAHSRAWFGRMGHASRWQSRGGGSLEIRRDLDAARRTVAPCEAGGSATIAAAADRVNVGCRRCWD